MLYIFIRLNSGWSDDIYACTSLVQRDDLLQTFLLQELVCAFDTQVSVQMDNDTSATMCIRLVQNHED